MRNLAANKRLLRFLPLYFTIFESAQPPASVMEFRLLVALLLVFTCSELAKAKLKGDDCEGTAQFVQYYTFYTQLRPP